MPSSSALVTFEAPGSAPTTTAVVRFDTLPGDLKAVQAYIAERAVPA